MALRVVQGSICLLSGSGQHPFVALSLDDEWRGCNGLRVALLHTLVAHGGFTPKSVYVVCDRIDGSTGFFQLPDGVDKVVIDAGLQLDARAKITLVTPPTAIAYALASNPRPCEIVGCTHDELVLPGAWGLADAARAS
jgi:hypothetical protein